MRFFQNIDFICSCNSSISKSFTDAEMASQLLELSEEVNGINYIIMSSLINSLRKDETLRQKISNRLLHRLFLSSSLSRCSHRRNTKMVRNTINVIRLFADDYDVCQNMWSEYDSDAKSRCLAILFLTTLSPNNIQDMSFALKLTDEIKIAYKEINKKKRVKEFHNSITHRQKTRLFQLFSLLLPLWDTDNSKESLLFICSVLKGEKPLCSIRFYTEWLLALLCLRNKSLLPIFMEQFKECASERIGSASSFILSLSLIGCYSVDAEIKELSLETILPWSMSHNYSTRFYAQASVANLWATILADKKYDSLRAKYSPLQACLFSNAEKDVDAFKNAEALKKEFFFSLFDPVKHFTLETIFYEFPRLALISLEEQLDLKVLCEIQSKEKLRVPLNIKLFNEGKELSSACAPVWVIKESGRQPIQTAFERKEMMTECNITGNLQTKILPIRDVLNPLRPKSSEKVSKPDSGHLIVVCSYVSKVANLGGLCRSCEIFGVEEMVVSSLAVRDMAEFKALSVDAQEWVNMVEVTPGNLPDYLEEKRQSGYQLLGVEQTHNSISLSEYNFPKKAVLLLGNEREGLPCDVLPLLDACIEIPQLGVCRSLNVHVCGAIVMWEYLQSFKTLENRR